MTVLVALLMGTPSTVMEELAPVAARVKATELSLPMEKSAALPEAVDTRERRVPVASVTTFAVTPRGLRIDGRGELVEGAVGCHPVPTLMVVVVPPTVMSKLPAESVAELLVKASEYHEPVDGEAVHDDGVIARYGAIGGCCRDGRRYWRRSHLPLREHRLWSARC